MPATTRPAHPALPALRYLQLRRRGSCAPHDLQPHGCADWKEVQLKPIWTARDDRERWKNLRGRCAGPARRTQRLRQLAEDRGRFGFLMHTSITGSASHASRQGMDRGVMPARRFSSSPMHPLAHIVLPVEGISHASRTTSTGCCSSHSQDRRCRTASQYRRCRLDPHDLAGRKKFWLMVILGAASREEQCVEVLGRWATQKRPLP